MTPLSRAQQIDRARRQAQLSVQQLWLGYISLSGIADLLEVDAYLHGLFTLDSYQEDKLSIAVNAELDELHQAIRLPYDVLPEPTHVEEDPLEVLRALLQADRTGNNAGDGGLRGSTV